MKPQLGREWARLYTNRPNTIRAKFNYPKLCICRLIKSRFKISGRQNPSNFSDGLYKLLIRCQSMFLL